MSRRSQLRIYTVDPATSEEWVARFYEHIVPLREQHGFIVEWSLLSEDSARFAWLVSHEDGDNWEAAEATYYASPERSAVPFSPGDYISAHDVTMVRPVGP
jgi:hypothetical protein